MGDLSLLAADIVGPGGRVVGVDRDPGVVEHARRRASEHGCSSRVSFETAHLHEFASDEPFDALVGRYILLYQPDPAGLIRYLLQFVKPGGIVVFHELDLTDLNPTYPPCALYDKSYALLAEALRRAGIPPDFGRQLAKHLSDAGLPFPSLASETVLGGGVGSYVYPWIASTVISVAPRLEALGLALPDGLAADHTMAPMIEEEAVRLQSQVLAPTQFGAWTRRPLGPD